MKIALYGLLVSTTVAAAIAQTGPRNMDFRQGAVGQEPMG